MNAEHSWADAPVIGHMWEHILFMEDTQIGYDENGHSKGTMRYEDELPEPSRLKFDFNKKVWLSLSIVRALRNW